MELDADEEGMIRDLNDLYEAIVWRSASNNEAGIDELFTVVIIKFVAMTMTL